MSFLKPLAPLFGLGGMAAAGQIPMKALAPLGGITGMLLAGGGGGDKGAAATPQPNAAATGLGKLLGVDPGRISSIADSVGKGMNQIAQGGGAAGGYAAPQLPDAPVQNHLQLLDPTVIQALIQRFGGGAMR